MTELSGCDEIRLSLGVYVVGAIDPAERSAVDKHLSQCADCQAELAGLAGLPALLGRVPGGDVERLADASPGASGPAEPPKELLDSLLRRVNVRRKVQRWRAVAATAAAAVIAVGGGIAGGAAISSLFGSGPAASTAASAPPAGPALRQYETDLSTNSRTHVTAVVKYYSANWGTSMRVWVGGVPAGTTCQFWVVDALGQRSLAGSWTERADTRGLWFPATSALSGSAIHDFVVTSAGRVLVTVPAT
ncbi:MAG TPA: zf-HC2 domain-containing protein [Streptosporangiaceae bacterium]|jgi:hypothetical protein